MKKLTVKIMIFYAMVEKCNHCKKCKPHIVAFFNPTSPFLIRVRVAGCRTQTCLAGQIKVKIRRADATLALFGLGDVGLKKCVDM